MNSFLYILIGLFLFILAVSFFARYFWVFLLIYIIAIAAKIIKGIFFDHSKKETYQNNYDTYSSNYDQGYSNYSSSSNSDIIEAEYTIVEEKETDSN